MPCDTKSPSSHCGEEQRNFNHLLHSIVFHSVNVILNEMMIIVGGGGARTDIEMSVHCTLYARTV